MEQSGEIKPVRNGLDEESEVDVLARLCKESIIQELSGTKFACAELILLPSGTTNYVFRGTLKEPLGLATTAANNNDDDGSTGSVSKTIIIKHLEGFARLNPALRIDGSRGSFEAFMLGKLQKLCQNQNFQVSQGHDVRAPRLLHASAFGNTFVLEDFGTECLNLKEHLKNAKASDGYAPEEIMRDVGRWLRAFHDWTSIPGQDDIVGAMRDYNDGGDFKRRMAYDHISTFCEKVGILDQMTITSFKQLETVLAEETAGLSTKHATAEWGPTHSDFWTGNILVPPGRLQPELPRFSIIDWEFACLAPRAYDLGQMIGDLVELHQLTRSLTFHGAIANFAEGYGALSRALAFRILIHAGAHLMGWYVRGPKGHLGQEAIQQIVRFGRDMVCLGLKQNEEWFRDNALGAIFDQVAKLP